MGNHYSLVRMPHLVVLGTSHTLQCGDASVLPSVIGTFETELRALIQKHSVKRVSEEMSPDGLQRHGVAETVGQRVARELGLEHGHIDLGTTERIHIGLHDAPLFTIQRMYKPADCGQSFRDAITVLYDEIRERVWVHRLLSQDANPILFICGSEHVAPVARLWRLLGLSCDIAHRDYAA